MIVYATNISPVVTLDQMRTFFGFLGDIVDIAMYHYEKAPETNFKVCFVEFSQQSSVSMAQHLTNTIFIDRAIFVLPYNKPKIPPSKEIAEEWGYADTEYVTNINPDVSTQVTTGANGAQVITTTDPRLTAASLQQYPQLPINTDPTRIEEIRRTLYIGNLDSSMSPETVLKFFNDIGEVKYIRVAGDETQPTRFAFVEFTHQASVANALLYHGFVFGIKALKINHSNNPIVKPQPKLEIEDPSKKHLDGRSAHGDLSSRDRHHSSKNDRKRDRRGYYDRRVSPRDQRLRRSRSKDRDSYSRSRRSRSRDHSARRSRSRDELPRRRSRSRDLSERRRSRSRSSERRSKHKSSSRRR
jgi:arginine/serine-rich splicing factor 12